MSDHKIERRWLTEAASKWAPLFGGDSWYRCTICGMISSKEPTDECGGPDQ